MAKRTISKEDAMYELGITSEKYFRNLCYKNKIKRVERDTYYLTDIRMLKLLPKKPKKKVIAYQPVYVIRTYYIYESKMNYEQVI